MKLTLWKQIARVFVHLWEIFLPIYVQNELIRLHIIEPAA